MPTEEQTLIEEQAQEVAQITGLSYEEARMKVQYYRSIWLGVEPITVSDIVAFIRYFSKP